MLTKINFTLICWRANFINNVLSSTNLVKWWYGYVTKHFCISNIIPAEGNCWWWLSQFYVLPCDIYKNNFWDKYTGFSIKTTKISLFSIKLYSSGLSRSVLISSSLISSFLKWNNIQIKEEIEPNHTCMYM